MYIFECRAPLLEDIGAYLNAVVMQSQFLCGPRANIREQAVKCLNVASIGIEADTIYDAVHVLPTVIMV